MSELAAKIEKVLKMISPLDVSHEAAYQEPGDCVRLDNEEFVRFSKLAKDIRIAAIDAKLEHHLPTSTPSIPSATVLHLPGRRRGGYYLYLEDAEWVEPFYEVKLPINSWLDQLRLVARLPEKSKGKGGRPSTQADDKRIYDEYYYEYTMSITTAWKTRTGAIRPLTCGRTTTLAAKKSLNSAKAWLSTLLKREKERGADK